MKIECLVEEGGAEEDALEEGAAEEGVALQNLTATEGGVALQNLTATSAEGTTAARITTLEAPPTTLKGILEPHTTTLEGISVCA